MPSHAFSDLFGEVDSKFAAVTSNAAAGMSAYVMPIGWAMLGISLLVYSALILEGKINNPMLDWMSRGVGMMFVLMASGIYYGPWISSALTGLPTALSAAVGNSSSPTQLLDTLAGNLEAMVAGIATGAVDAFVAWNIGGGVLLFFAVIDVTLVGCVLLVACAFNLMYAKIGLGIVLVVGPFFVLCLFWPQSKNYFYSWLSTVLYFIFLAVISTLFVVFFIGIAQTFMTQMESMIKGLTASGGTSSYAAAVADAIKAWANNTPVPASSAPHTSASQLFNIVALVVEINFVFMTMILVAIDMKSMVASLTGGSGGSAGSGAGRILQHFRH
ncbi:type IV secretion system protein [Massilia sp. R2A-15]|uniref:type IV secretion system protein n=1 Tax=Massilia sp. R2A-15 TaxID=3064278 RepID=UPI0027367F23|nr:type IV secretion system protein [Massilia sp. R2A-15]WLI87823.1 type IV secretion system protein [Massilia sp. R2A-15]